MISMVSTSESESVGVGPRLLMRLSLRRSSIRHKTEMMKVLRSIREDLRYVSLVLFGSTPSVGRSSPWLKSLEKLAHGVNYVLGRYPVLKIHHTVARHTARKPTVMARLIPTLTPAIP